MTAIHGKATGVLLGVYNPTRYFRDISPKRSIEVADASHFESNAKEYVAGMGDGEVGFGGLFPKTTEGLPELDMIQAYFEDIEAVDEEYPVLIVFGGWATGNRAQLGSHKTAKFDVKSPISDVVSISGTLKTTAGLRSGRLLMGAAQAVEETVNGSALDNGSATSAGGVLQYHVIDNTRDSDTTLTLQHSANGSVWTDLEVLPTVAAEEVVSDRVALPPSINRYTRIIVNFASGTGSAVIAAALARN